MVLIICDELTQFHGFYQDIFSRNFPKNKKSLNFQEYESIAKNRSPSQNLPNSILHIFENLMKPLLLIFKVEIVFFIQKSGLFFFYSNYFPKNISSSISSILSTKKARLSSIRLFIIIIYVRQKLIFLVKYALSVSLKLQKLNYIPTAD